MTEKNKFKTHWIFLLAGALFLIGACIPFLGGGSPSVVIQSSGESSPAESNSSRRGTRKSRGELSSEFFARSQADSCGSRDNERCERLCVSIYDDDYGAQEECFKLKTETVYDLDNIESNLRDPSIGELKNINHKIFELFMALSVKPWIEALRKADRTEAGIILAWIAQTKDISAAILEYGATGDYVNFKSYEGLKELLKAVSRDGSTDCAQYKSGFEESLNDSSFSFCEIAIRQSNTKVTSQAAENGILGDFLREKECGQCWDVNINTANDSCTFGNLSSDPVICNED